MNHTFNNVPDYLVPIEHSALGTSWAKKVHKYIKKVGNKYYYDTRVAVDTAKHTVQRTVNNAKKASAKKAQAENKSYAQTIGAMRQYEKTGQSANAALAKSQLKNTSKGRKQLANVARIKAKDTVNNVVRRATTPVVKASNSAKKSVSSILKKLGVTVNDVKNRTKSSIATAKFKRTSKTISKNIANRNKTQEAALTKKRTR